MFKRSTGRVNRNDEIRNTRRDRDSTLRDNFADSRLIDQSGSKYGVNSGDPVDTDSLIADMAKGFVAAQAKINATSNDNDGNGEMLQLLTKISRQLDNLQQAGPTNRTPDMNNQQRTGSIASGGQQADQEGLQTGSNMAQQQQMPVSQVSADNHVGSGAMTDTQQRGQIVQQQQMPNSQASAGSQTGTGTMSGAQAGNQLKAAPAQTAAQLLSQAQFELSQELEASLQKLKQVIADSENLAGRISTLIGKENNSQ